MSMNLLLALAGCETNPFKDATVDSGDTENGNDSVSENLVTYENIDLSSENIVTLSGEINYSQAGAAVAFSGDQNEDSLSDILVGAPSSTGSAYLVTSPLNEDQILYEYGSWRMAGENYNSHTGAAVAGQVDLNADGIDDIVIGAPGYYTGPTNNVGAAYVVYGPIDESLSLEDADHRIVSDQSHDVFGSAIATSNNFWGAGFWVGSPSYDGISNESAVYYFSELVDDNLNLNDATMIFRSDNLPRSTHEAGRSLASGSDLNGDGLDDLVIGAPEDGTLSSGGAAYLFYGGTNYGNTLVSDADTYWVSDVSGSQLGKEVAIVDDVDGDGLSDVALGAPNAYYNSDLVGAVYLFYSVPEGQASVGRAEVILTGEQAGSDFGDALSSAGDVDSDGFSEIIVGAPESLLNKGVSYLFAGPIEEGSHAVQNVASYRFLGEVEGEEAGSSLAGGTDVTGDGIPDFLVGAPEDRNGKVYVVSGRSLF